MSTVTMSHQSFSFSLFTQLVRRLRHANARYNLIAYQCRRTQHPTYHAKRQAYRVGLRIDTSKARVAWSSDHVSPPLAVCEATPRPPPVLNSTAIGLAWVASEVETKSEEGCLPNPWPKPENVVRKQSTTPCLSPLDLGLRTVDDPDTYDMPYHGPVPGAPRWRPKPLPEDDLECVSGMATMTNEVLSSSSSGANCTYDPDWQGVMGAHVSDLMSLPVSDRLGG